MKQVHENIAPELEDDEHEVIVLSGKVDESTECTVCLGPLNELGESHQGYNIYRCAHCCQLHRGVARVRRKNPR